MQLDLCVELLQVFDEIQIGEVVRGRVCVMLQVGSKHHVLAADNHSCGQLAERSSPPGGEIDRRDRGALPGDLSGQQGTPLIKKPNGMLVLERALYADGFMLLQTNQHEALIDVTQRDKLSIGRQDRERVATFARDVFG